MRVLVDTCIWSYVLRNKENHDKTITELTELIKESRVEIIDGIRQETLSGIKHTSQFDKLKNVLASFPSIKVIQQDYEFAAELFHKLRTKGIQCSNTDFLICAVAINRDLSIFTDDKASRTLKSTYQFSYIR